MTKRYFEDINDGEFLDCKKIIITREDIIEFARKFDPQIFHIDDKAAKKSIFGGLVASSLHTLSVCTRVVVDAQGDVAILSGVGMYEVKMTNPVRPDDILSVEAWWTDFRRSKSKPELGFAGIKCKVTNQDSEPVVEYGYRYIIACKNPV